MNCVVIPCYNRGEYLKICLEFIEKADNYKNYRYVFACDHGCNKETLQIIDSWNFPNKEKVYPKPHSFKNGKQSFNVINGLITAASKSNDFVFYIEDDVFIGKDFFTFAEKILNKSKSDIVILSKNVNGKDNTIADKNGFYKKVSNEYQGIGSCFTKHFILDFLKKDFNDDYFNNLSSYILKNYPLSPLNSNYAEQDGLIRRIIEKNNLTVSFSHVPRCFHAGFYGYHRIPNKVTVRLLPFNARYALVKKVAFNVNELKKIAQHPNLVEDSLPVDLKTTHEDCVEIPI